jgi:hypothetical protein
MKDVLIKVARVIYTPVGWRTTDEGNKPRYARTGVRVEMQNGDWWFLRFKSGKWTAHTKELIPVKHTSTYRYCDRQCSYTRDEVETQLTPLLLTSLNNGVAFALQDELARRLEFGVSKWGGLIPRSSVNNIADAANSFAKAA